MDEWVHEFNNIRPHQALNGDTPAQHYRKSPRIYSSSLVDYDYGNMPTRKIDKHGDLKWHSMDYFLSEAERLPEQTAAKEAQAPAQIPDRRN